MSSLGTRSGGPAAASGGGAGAGPAAGAGSATGAGPATDVTGGGPAGTSRGKHSRAGASSPFAADLLYDDRHAAAAAAAVAAAGAGPLPPSGHISPPSALLSGPALANSAQQYAPPVSGPLFGPPDAATHPGSVTGHHSPHALPPTSLLHATYSPQTHTDHFSAHGHHTQQHPAQQQHDQQQQHQQHQQHQHQQHPQHPSQTQSHQHDHHHLQHGQHAQQNQPQHSQHSQQTQHTQHTHQTQQQHQHSQSQQTHAYYGAPQHHSQQTHPSRAHAPQGQAHSQHTQPPHQTQHQHQQQQQQQQQSQHSSTQTHPQAAAHHAALPPFGAGIGATASVGASASAGCGAGGSAGSTGSAGPVPGPGPGAAGYGFEDRNTLLPGIPSTHLRAATGTAPPKRVGPFGPTTTTSEFLYDDGRSTDFVAHSIAGSSGGRTGNSVPVFGLDASPSLGPAPPGPSMDVGAASSAFSGMQQHHPHHQHAAAAAAVATRGLHGAPHPDNPFGLGQPTGAGYGRVGGPQGIAGVHGQHAAPQQLSQHLGQQQHIHPQQRATPQHLPDPGATYQHPQQRQQFGISTLDERGRPRLLHGGPLGGDEPRAPPDLVQFVSGLNGPLDKPIVCTQCTQSFGDHGSLQRHIARTHRSLGMKGPVNCEQCNAELKNEQNLKRHIAVCHTGPQEHTCQICRATFTSRGSLRIHQQQVHNMPPKVKKPEPPMPPVLAPMPEALPAGTSDAVPGGRKKPKSKTPSKANEKSWACDMCTDTFKWKGNLKRHRELRHLHLRPFVCHVCRASFGTKSNMRVHLITHDKNGTYAASSSAHGASGGGATL